MELEIQRETPASILDIVEKVRRGLVKGLLIFNELPTSSVLNRLLMCEVA